MRLALETATERASVAVGRGPDDAVERDIVGARRQASALVPMLDEALRAAGVSLDDLEGVVLSDGPGSFTGLRVGAAVAKGLVRARGVPLWIAPSLLVRAAGVARPGETVLAVTDALRGEVYAAAYRFAPEAIHTVLQPSVHRPEALAASGIRPDRVVGEVPAAAAQVLERGLDRPLTVGAAGAPRARRLLGLADVPGGARRVEAVDRWEPDYGRPAEAQARWETAHGRALPDTSGRPG